MLTFSECCRHILSNRQSKAVNWAVNYAQAGLNMTGYDAKMQALYILNNIQYWRGDTAKRVRESLKAISRGA